MRLLSFFCQYTDDASCKEFFKARKEKEGVVCTCCGSVLHYWIEKETRWKCRYCGKSSRLKNGTAMEHSNLGYKVWLWGLYLMNHTTKVFSAREMQRLFAIAV